MKPDLALSNGMTRTPACSPANRQVNAPVGLDVPAINLGRKVALPAEVPKSAEEKPWTRLFISSAWLWSFWRCYRSSASSEAGHGNDHHHYRRNRRGPPCWRRPSPRALSEL